MNGEQTTLDAKLRARQWVTTAARRIVTLKSKSGRELQISLTVEVIGGKWSYTLRHGEVVITADAHSERHAKTYALRRAERFAKGEA